MCVKKTTTTDMKLCSQISELFMMKHNDIGNSSLCNCFRDTEIHETLNVTLNKY